MPKPAPGVVDAITSADAVIIAPSNPVTSIGPILAVPGIHNALLQASRLAAKSPPSAPSWAMLPSPARPES